MCGCCGEPGRRRCTGEDVRCKRCERTDKYRKAARKSFSATWKKQSKQTSGYQVQYSTNKKFAKSVKTSTISKNTTVKKTVKKLSAKKTYYVRVRTYKTVKVGKKSVKIYSGWSAAKKVKTK